MQRIAAFEGAGRAAAVLRDGGVVAFPTDTLYGLAVDPRRDDAVERLFALKGRRPDAALPLIAADLAQAMEAGEFGASELRLAQAFWPGPLSIVVAARAVISRAALGVLKLLVDSARADVGPIKALSEALARRQG